MKFQEALETGLPFKRKGWEVWCQGTGEIWGDRAAFLATDWEVQPPKIELTREKFMRVYMDSINYGAHAPTDMIKYIADKLFGADKCNQ